VAFEVPKLDEISDGQVLESGVWRSVDVLKAPLWVDGQNIDFRKGSVQKAQGWSVITQASGSINSLAQAFVDGNKRVYLGRSGALDYYVDGQEIYPIVSGLAAGGMWSQVAWGKFLLAVDGVNRVQFWQNTGLAESLVGTDAPVTADIIRPLNIYTPVFNVDGEPGVVRWPVGGDPTTWTPAPSNDANRFQIRNVTSKIMAAEPVGDDILAFTQSQTFRVYYIGGDEILTWQKLSDSLGAIGKNCVVVVGGRAYGLERRGFWETDGVRERWLAEPQVWDHFKSRIDFDRGDEVVGYYNRERATIEWNWPLVGGGQEGWAYGLNTNQWAPRSYGLTAAGGDGVFGKPVAANGTELRLMGDGVDAGVDALEAYIQTKPLAMGSTDHWKWLDEIRLRRSGNGLVAIGYQESPDDEIEWTSAQTMVERHYPNRDTVFVSLKFSSIALGADWSVSAMEFFGKMGGSRS
jgi:hypothetical protein